MDAKRVKHILDGVKDGTIPVDEALEELARLPFTDIGLAVVDHHRSLRTGFPEVVLGEGKTATQIAAIVTELRRGRGNVLVTRVAPALADAVRAAVPDMEHRLEARALVLKQAEVARMGHGPIAIVTAGTSDIGVAEEAALVAELAGNEVVRMFDVGVAGIHRLFHRLDDLRRASVIVVAAGMEGALASVVGGLVSCPVIAVPTSVGYGASFGGVAALLGMLSTCAAGVTVVNIDNGFGAGYAAALMNRVGRAHGAK
ncbi:MAG: nickel pincer cofactor biosynthesis protein LarB [Deltaproteobacteria bacterium]|nr:nickel pincer cofactor biosynthesis protein LarB [Deltaproteobacteria bacterium]